MINRRRRLALGLQVVMTMFAHAKGVGSTAGTAKAPAPKPKAPIDQTAKFDFTKLLEAGNHPDLLREVEEKRRSAEEMANATWSLAVRTASDALMPHSGGAAQTIGNAFSKDSMTHEEARLWLQSFNAGPYALLRYQGDVPYKETQNYYPRVMKYYEQDLSNTPYEPFIQKSAAKYGLDPQFVRAIMKTESDFRNSTVSSAGARGLMQVMPVVWSEIKKKYGMDWDYNSGVFEPEKNIEVACAYLAWLKYDFLPRHFAVFEKDPEAPAILVRDKDRGVPDRETPRIETAIASLTPVQADPTVVPPATPQAAPAAVVAAAPAKQDELAKPVEAAKPAERQVAQADTLAAKKTAPPPRATEAAPRAKPADVAAPAVDPGKAKVQIAFVGEKKVTTKTQNGKTVVSIRPDQAAVTKKPAMAGTVSKAVADSDAKSKALKLNPRGLKKPSVASADVSREEESRS